MGTSRNKVSLSPQLKLGVGRGYSKNNLLKYSGFLFLFLSLILVGWTVYVVVSRNTENTAQTTEKDPQVLGATDNEEAVQHFKNYTVVKGDTVFNIAQKHNVSWTTLATINNLAAPFTLKPGQTLKIPQQ
jgi:LysM repeat protein